jgi:hypothetical protein
VGCMWFLFAKCVPVHVYWSPILGMMGYAPGRPCPSISTGAWKLLNRRAEHWNEHSDEQSDERWGGR